MREVIGLTFGNTADLQSDVIRVGKSEGCIYYLETVVNTEMLKEMLGNTLENSADKDIVVDTIEDLQSLSKKSFGVSGYKLLKRLMKLFLLSWKDVLLLFLEVLGRRLV
ncbi:hypothetical protein AAHH67_28335 [Niallia circulans]